MKILSEIFFNYIINRFTGDLNIVPVSVDQWGNEYLCSRKYLEVGEEVELHHPAEGIVGEGEGNPSRRLGVGPGEFPGQIVRLID